MRALVLFALVATSASAQTAGLPRFEDYPAGPAYRGRVAPLVLSSSATARTYRTMTRQAMAEGVNFAGHYVVATWGCGTECMGGVIVDARTGRAVADLPGFSPFTTFRLDSRLIAVMTPEEVLERFPPEDDVHIPSHYQSSYWVLDGRALRHLGSFVASDLEQIRAGGPIPALRTASPGDVLVPLTVGNTWTYAGTSPGGPVTVTYRVTGPDPEPYSDGVLVERLERGRGGEVRTVETWTTYDGVGDGGLNIRTADDTYRGFAYAFGVPEGDGQRVERATVQIGAEAREAVCYVEGEGGDSPAPRRTCFVPRLGMVSDDGRDTLTLTSHRLR
ncbi:MAG TPA: hypothetical protein VF594_01260 [Rubricoccaceae bacterium]|jgi:hypothetical protein